MSHVLVAGATGTLGRHVVAELKARGHTVRALVRDSARLDELRLPVDEVTRGDLTDAASLAGVCDGVDAVVSCAGASMRLGGMLDRRGFGTVDHEGNRNLLARAHAAGVGRFVYVSVFGGPEMAATAYAGAHERFVAELRASGLPHTVVRPTGFFSFFDAILEMAARGRAAVIGPGHARTNPVHEADVAAACTDALESAAPEPETALGGPDVLTRREIVELALRVAGRNAPVRSFPAPLLRALVAPLRILNPRLHALLDFGAAVSLAGCVAPPRGTRRLEDHFRARASSLRG